MARFDLSDFDWSVIQPLLPTKVRGVACVDDRRVINCILWRLRTGAPWANISERYGPHMTCYNRFVRWRKAGVWDRILQAVSEAYSGDVQMIDSSSIRVHQHGANGKKGAIRLHGSLAGWLDHEDPAVVDALGLPIKLALSEGQAYDGHQARTLLNDLPPRAMVLADRAYDADAIRGLMSDQNAWANIPPMPHRRLKPVFSKHLYKMRNLVERFFNQIKYFRAVATRYDKDPENYLAGIKLASIRIWLRFNESVT